MVTSNLLPRLSAIEVVRRVTAESYDLQHALNSTLRKQQHNRQQRAFITELCYGYFRRRISINSFVDSFLRQPGKLPAICKDIIGLAAYEILHMSKTPEFASVDSAVRIVRKEYGKTLANVANGVLRNICRQAESYTSGAFFDAHVSQRVTRLSQRFSCPQWITKLWIEAYGEEQALVFLHASLQKPLTGVRINASCPSADALFQDLSAVAAYSDSDMYGLASDNLDVGAIERFEKEGALSRMSFSSQQALWSLHPDCFLPPVLDVCAGRGSKTLAIQERIRGLLFASDVNSAKVKQLAAEAIRLHQPQPNAFVSDASRLPIIAAKAQSIIIDAPCSGLGVLSRRPDIKHHRTVSDVETLCALQKRIVAECASKLSSGGMLGYITCTLTPEENERQIEEACRTNRMIVESQWSTPTDGSQCEFFWTASLRKK